MNSILIKIVILCLALLLIIIFNVYNNVIKNKRNAQNLKLNVYKRYKVITLCGSTKFKNEFETIQKELTLKGYIVLSVGCFGHSGDVEVWKTNTKEMLDDMHKRKIDLADAIMVINKNGYIGDSTQSEINYAKITNKEILYYYK